MDDARAVMDAAGSQRAAVLGYSEGGLLAALFAATYPDRTEALILWDTFARVAVDAEDEPDSEPWLELRRLALDAIEHWGEGRFLHVVAPTVAESPEIRRRYGLFERAAAEPGDGALPMGRDRALRHPPGAADDSRTNARDRLRG